ncbi:MAG: 5-formyltetrahydrofolate cyclo-ligase [Vibrionaceae bacterium]
MQKEKAQLRTLFRQKRQQLSIDEQQQAQALLLARFIASPHVQVASCIALYIAHNGEIGTQALIQYCWQQGKHVYVPVVHPFASGELLFLRYMPDTPMQKCRWGILQPKLDVRAVLPVWQLELIGLPLVAFDAQGNRLGMGGGFYDRTLASFANHSHFAKPYVLGLAHDCQLAASLPVEPWDRPLPEILTPSKDWLFS